MNTIQRLGPSHGPVGPPAPVADDTIEHALSWTAGGIMSKTRTTARRSESTFIHDRLALGFGFQAADGEFEWKADGSTILASNRTSSGGSRDLIVLPAGCEFHGAARGRGECVWIYVDRELVESRGIGRSIASTPCADSAWSEDRLLWTLMSALREECHHDFSRGTLFSEAASLVFITQLETFLRGRRGVEAAVGALSRTKVRTVIDYIESQCARNISLSELSALVGLSPVHFCRAFKESTGRSPHQFVIERRVDKARALLCETGFSLAEIALATGFSHQSHLNHHFHRLIGATPGRYRRENSLPDRARRDQGDILSPVNL